MLCLADHSRPHGIPFHMKISLSIAIFEVNIFSSIAPFSDVMRNPMNIYLAILGIKDVTRCP